MHPDNDVVGTRGTVLAGRPLQIAFEPLKLRLAKPA